MISRASDTAPVVSMLMGVSEDVLVPELKISIDRVLKQQLREIELIVVDDSGENLAVQECLVQAAQADPRISLILHKDPVFLRALCYNEAILHARGKYIAFAEPGFRMYPNGLNQTIKFMEESGLSACYSRAYKQSNDKRLTDLYFMNFIALPSVVLHRDIFSAIGLFDPSPLYDKHFDWDFFLRLVNRFDLRASGIRYLHLLPGAYKVIPGQANDHLDQDMVWALWEHFRLERNAQLSPDKYKNYDPLKLLGDRSANYRAMFAENCKKYSDATWAKDALARMGNTPEGPNIKRILVSCIGTDASVTLHFDRIFKGTDLVVRYQQMFAVSACDVQAADILIIVRFPNSTKNQQMWAKMRNMPCYYFVDDQFAAAYDDFPDDEVIEMIAAAVTREGLSDFDGVIVPSPHLQQYYLENLHENTLLCEPNIDEENIRLNQGEKVDFHVAFFGSGFRERYLKTCILPALQKISEQKPVVLFCPEGTGIRSTSQSLKVVKLPRNYFLPAALETYARNRVDVQVHPTETLKHSAYKTKNSLINATQMGAVLAVSEAPPFTVEESYDEGCFVVGNSVDEWYEVLSKLAFDEDFRQQTYARALKHCLERYSPRKTEAALLPELENCRQSTVTLPADPVNPILLWREGSYNIGYPDDELRLHFKIKKGVTYKNTCPVSGFKEVGILFETQTTCKGNVVLTVRKDGKTLGQAKARMEDIIPKHWCYFQFEEQCDVKNERLEFQFDLQYEAGHGLLGIYEDQRRRPFIYKVLEKLFKLRLPNHDVMCINWIK